MLARDIVLLAGGGRADVHRLAAVEVDENVDLTIRDVARPSERTRRLVLVLRRRREQHLPRNLRRQAALERLHVYLTCRHLANFSRESFHLFLLFVWRRLDRAAAIDYDVEEEAADEACGDD